MEESHPFINTYQLAGVDNQERGFTRQIKVSSRNGLYKAALRYEALRLEGTPCDTDETALRNLVQALQQRGYTQLRTQLIFRGDQYLGSQELWVEYADPKPQSESIGGIKKWLRCFFKMPSKD